MEADWKEIYLSRMAEWESRWRKRKEFPSNSGIKSLHYENGKLHRLDGPAVEHNLPAFWEVWVDGDFLFSASSQSEKWLSMREEAETLTKKNEVLRKQVEQLEQLHRKLMLTRNFDHFGVKENREHLIEPHSKQMFDEKVALGFLAGSAFGGLAMFWLTLLF